MNKPAIENPNRRLRASPCSRRLATRLASCDSSTNGFVYGRVGHAGTKGIAANVYAYGMQDIAIFLCFDASVPLGASRFKPFIKLRHLPTRNRPTRKRCPVLLQRDPGRAAPGILDSLPLRPSDAERQRELGQHPATDIQPAPQQQHQAAPQQQRQAAPDQGQHG